jgi:hypothetical protein
MTAASGFLNAGTGVSHFDTSIYSIAGFISRNSCRVASGVLGDLVMRFGWSLAAATLLFAGCASITRGTSEAVTFDSEPSGAEMRSLVRNICHDEGSCTNSENDERFAAPNREHSPGPSCVTPCTIEVKRSDELIVTFIKPGYEPITIDLGRNVSGAGGLGFAGNVIAGGATGMVVDGITGAAMDHVPNPMKVVLVPIKRTIEPRAKKR